MKPVLVLALFLTACGGAEVNYQTPADTPGPDSSVILPALIEDTTSKDSLVAIPDSAIQNP